MNWRNVWRRRKPSMTSYAAEPRSVPLPLSVCSVAVSGPVFSTDSDMEQKELSIVLRELARSQKVGLCDEWYSEWADDSDLDALLDKFRRTP